MNNPLIYIDPTGYACSDGTCSDGTCSNNSQCGPGQVCNNGVCEGGEGGCNNSYLDSKFDGAYRCIDTPNGGYVASGYINGIGTGIISARGSCCNPLGTVVGNGSQSFSADLSVSSPGNGDGTIGGTGSTYSTDFNDGHSGGGDGIDSANSPLAAAFAIAIPISAADGPLPIGELISLGILSVATAYDVTHRTFVTYTLHNPTTGQWYAGRASGFGHPHSIMMNRYAYHHMKALGFINPTLDRAVQGIEGYPAIRGREQQLIDSFGGVGSRSVGNAIRGVSKYNPLGRIYHKASNALFGLLAPYTGY